MLICGIGFAASCGDSKNDNDADSEQSAMIVDEITDAVGQPGREGFFPRFDTMRNYLSRPANYAMIFNDSNKYQYAHAERLGIAPIRTLRDAYRTSRPLVLIEGNSNYSVDELTHSMPYLVPEASDLLDYISDEFMKRAPGYRVRVTSLLRTPATVKKLRRVNINATDSSTHQFGTTFDLAYTRFPHISGPEISEGELKAILAEVLFEARLQERCMVKFERKTHCFHITAVR